MPNISDLYFPSPDYNSSSLLDYWIYIDNHLVSGWFSPLMLVLIFAVTYMATSRFRHEEAFATASFITLLSSIFLAALNVATPLYIIYPMIMFAVSIYLLHKS